MTIIVLGFLLVTAGLYFAVGGLGGAHAGGTALRGISIQGPSWLLLVALGVGTILFGAWLEHDRSTTIPTNPEDKLTEVTVLAPSTYGYGEDPYLDELWDACALGDWLACDDLYLQSPIDSDYEYFGATCGMLVPVPSGEYCAPQNRNNGEGPD